MSLDRGRSDLAVLPPGTLPGYAGYGFWGLRWSEKFETFGALALLLAVLYGIFIGIRSAFKKWGRRGRKTGRVSAPPPLPPRDW